MLEEWQTKWEGRSKLTCRASENSIRGWIMKYQKDNEEPIYYDWHPKDGFVAYKLREAEPLSAKSVEESLCELEGPYECGCGGHLKVDATFLDQVENKITCPYCKREILIPEEDIK